MILSWQITVIFSVKHITFNRNNRKNLNDNTKTLDSTSFQNLIRFLELFQWNWIRKTTLDLDSLQTHQFSLLSSHKRKKCPICHPCSNPSHFHYWYAFSIKHFHWLQFLAQITGPLPTTVTSPSISSGCCGPPPVADYIISYPQPRNSPPKWQISFGSIFISPSPTDRRLVHRYRNFIYLQPFAGRRRRRCEGNNLRLLPVPPTPTTQSIKLKVYVYIDCLPTDRPNDRPSSWWWSVAGVNFGRIWMWILLGLLVDECRQVVTMATTSSIRWWWWWWWLGWLPGPDL